MIKFEIYKETEIEAKGYYNRDDLYDFCENRTATYPELICSTDDYVNALKLFDYEKNFCGVREENDLIIFDELTLTISEYEGDDLIQAEIKDRYITEF